MTRAAPTEINTMDDINTIAITGVLAEAPFPLKYGEDKCGASIVLVQRESRGDGMPLVQQSFRCVAWQPWLAKDLLSGKYKGGDRVFVHGRLAERKIPSSRSATPISQIQILINGVMKCR